MTLLSALQNIIYTHRLYIDIATLQGGQKCPDEVHNMHYPSLLQDVSENEYFAGSESEEEQVSI